MNLPFQLSLSADDVAYAALLAFFLTWMVTTVSHAFKMLISHPARFDYNPRDLSKLLQKCYVLFPRDVVLFRGKTFKRGMIVRVTTVREKIFEGQLIGSNNDDMLCVITGKNIVAQELREIREMVVIES